MKNLLSKVVRVLSYMSGGTFWTYNKEAGIVRTDHASMMMAAQAVLNTSTANYSQWFIEEENLMFSLSIEELHDRLCTAEAGIVDIINSDNNDKQHNTTGRLWKSDNGYHVYQHNRQILLINRFLDYYKSKTAPEYLM